MSVTKRNEKRTTVNTFRRMKSKGKKITVLTAYDAFMASLLDSAGVDAILVGDSAANVVHGFDSTLPMTMEMMLTHTAAVARGTKRALIIGDMPFLSYQPSIETAVLNAGRFLKAGAHAVKIEGGTEMIPTIKRVIECGIPVMGHIGLTPQSIHRFGGPIVQGREQRSRAYMLDSAIALDAAGCFAAVLELVEADVARELTESARRMATIGIGAGPHTDGQVLVINDILGLRGDAFKPKFLREYADLKPAISDAVKKYIDDVRSGDFPGDKESYSQKD